MINGLDLFSGIGGLSIALNEWVRTVAYCERDRFAQADLLSRMRSGTLCRAGIWDDVCTLSGDQLEHLPIDIITGGFPCQDISVAGAGLGMEGKRSSLFLHIIRLTEEIEPAFVFLENVPAIRTRGLDVVLREFSAIGYDARWTVVSAEEVGAPHIRKRWFLLAHPHRKRVWKRPERKPWGWPHLIPTEGKAESFNDGAKRILADADDQAESQQGGPVEAEARDRSCSGGFTLADSMRIRCGQGLQRREVQAREFQALWGDWWKAEPAVGRVVDGFPGRVDRIRALGNAVVPLQAKTAFKRLMGIEK